MDNNKNDNNEYQQYITTWAELLNQPIPDLRRISVDIEVESEEGRMPTPRDHDRRVTAVGFVGNDGFKKVLVLEQQQGKSNDNGTSPPLIPEAEICILKKNYCKKHSKLSTLTQL